MGLDMYAFTTPERLDGEVDFAEPENVKKMFYWRKRWNLHDWMEALYRQKGGQSERFNLTTLALTLDDLDRLDRAIRADALPKGAGFVFPENDRQRNLSFVGQARAAIRQGLSVIYFASW